MNQLRKPCLILGLILILVSLLLNLIDYQSSGKIRWFDVVCKLYLMVMFFFLLRKTKNST